MLLAKSMETILTGTSYHHCL